MAKQESELKQLFEVLEPDQVLQLLPLLNLDIVMSFQKIEQVTGISVARLDRLKKQGYLRNSRPFGSSRVASLREIYNIYVRGLY